MEAKPLKSQICESKYYLSDNNYLQAVKPIFNKSTCQNAIVTVKML